MEAIIILVIIICGIVVLSAAIYGIINLCYGFIENKRKKAHPDLWAWLDEYYEAVNAECHYYNYNIASLERKIDNIIDDWDFYTAKTKSRKEQEVEALRKLVKTNKLVYSAMCAETQKIRDKIHNYVEQYNVDWAKRWGW